MSSIYFHSRDAECMTIDKLSYFIKLERVQKYARDDGKSVSICIHI